MPRGSSLPTGLPPDVIGHDAAAEFVSVSPGTFGKMVAEGLMPSPIRLYGNRKGWIVSELREAIGKLPRLQDAPAGGPDEEDTWR
ncbi:MAG TPA: hypothetical protein VNR51_01650 [Hyphomicrobium sp.]|nr:hypothetical protein [Hyphomicrobium sp.]